ncbi:YqiJ family protein [Halarcobacter sp.]|uniref:YqiJ family protein n=1 Tax=Halarcobacter sp. TaxID=2321133 RepID=UPI0029F5A73A|nr:YqiJ family protein [Halarcobacter sp.]
MSFSEFIFNHDNVIFSSAIFLMLLIAIFEGILVIIGAGLSDILDSFIPDFDTDINLETDTNFNLTKFFGWIRLKKVPVLMLLVIFLTSFGLIGLFIQLLVYNIIGILWLQYLVLIPTFILSIFSLRVFGGIIAKLLPKDETSSISRNDLIGHIAIITLGKAKKGSPAEAKVKDIYGQVHYFMIEPENENEVFEQGDKVLISAQNNKNFLAIKDIPEKLK